MFKIKKIITSFVVFSVVAGGAGCSGRETQQSDASSVSSNTYRAELKAQFLNPPNVSKPLTWLHAMSGNMSAEGITKDLEAIADAGIGGTLLFNVTQGIPLGKVKFNSPEHIDLIGHMAAESKRLGLSFGMHNCDGWTSSGGPWITPEHSMKQLAFSQTLVSGGDVSVSLEQPFTRHDFYRDVAVIAYPSLESEKIDLQQQPIVTASDSEFDSAVATNTDLDDYSTLKKEGNTLPWIQLSYKQPYTLRRIDMLTHNGRGLSVTLQTSDDGENFEPVRKLSLRRPAKSTYGFDEVFSGVTAKYFRLVADRDVNVKYLKFSATPSINNYLARSSASRTDYHQFDPIGGAAEHEIIKSNEVINLSAQMDSTGVLSAKLPEGSWTILRFGYTSTGAKNLPASREGTGLEVDKFSRSAFKTHWDAYITNVINKVKEVAPNALHTLEIDSYEVGAQNWTDDYHQKFEASFNYDLIPYLPLFAGKFVDSPEKSDSVLWDTRDLNNQLITKNYYQYFTELAHANGIQTYLEPYGSGPFNELDIGSKADLPMGEFWLHNNNFRISSSASSAHIYDKPIVSAEAFTQFPGNNWLFHPANGKADGDKSWALGVNQHVFHRFAHQANTHVMPGMTMNLWGAHFDRTQPWWNGAGKAWFQYITRGQHLLRIGDNVSDVLWYLGDASPTVCPEKDALFPLLPTYINYDCLNSEVLHQLNVVDGKLTLPHGQAYKVLVLDNHETLSISSLRAVYRLAQQGAVIVGNPVRRLAGRYSSEQDLNDFKSMVDFIWSQASTYRLDDVLYDAQLVHSHSNDDPSINPIFHIEAYSSSSKTINLNALYKKHGFQHDLMIKGLDQYYYTHRKSDEHDIYFIYNDGDERRLFDASFNVSGKIPELWDANTGEIKRLAAFDTDDKHTRIAFRLDPAESIFVVFSESSSGIRSVSPDVVVQHDIEVLLNDQNQVLVQAEGSRKSVSVDSLQFDTPDNLANIELTNVWNVQFNEHYGLGKSYTFEQLIDWRDHADLDVQNYSGTAVYTTRFNLDDTYLRDNQRVLLDLGEVNVAASVSINSKVAGTAWLAPYQLDISEFVKAGENQLEIEVANLWVNRLLADRKLPDNSGFKIARWADPVTKMPAWYTDNRPAPKSDRITFTTQRFMDDGEPSQSSGLIGPVIIKATSSEVLP